MPRARAIEIDAVWRWLAEVPDPEIPAISVVELGIVRDVRLDAHDDETRLVVMITPTYAGCPATEVIVGSIRDRLAREGLRDLRIETCLSPAWTTDWLTPQAKEKLRRYGIAPPATLAAGEQAVDVSRLLGRREPAPQIACPQCGSTRTAQISAHGSTPCKALYRCTSCAEPFDYFKPH